MNTSLSKKMQALIQQAKENGFKIISYSPEVVTLKKNNLTLKIR